VLNRTRREDIVVKHPFPLKGWAAPQPAGTYAAETGRSLSRGSPSRPAGASRP